MCFWLATLIFLIFACVKLTANPFYEFKAPGPFFSIPLHIGMPPQEINVTIDTCGLTSFVYGNFEGCYFGPEGKTCYPGFNKQKSISFKSLKDEHFNSPHGTGDGVLGKEIVTLGPYELTDTPAILGVADKVSPEMANKTRTVGFISMFAPVLPIDSVNASHMQQLAAESQYPIVSLFTPRCGIDMHSLTIGKSDDIHCKSEWADFELEPESEQTKMWTIKFESVTWGPNLNQKDAKAILSTAGDHMSAPAEQVAQMRRELSVVFQDDQQDRPTVNCEQRKAGPFIRFAANGHFLYMRPAQYIRRFKDGKCILNIFPDDKGYWILPYTFFQGYCARFDFKNRTVGFVQPKDFETCSLTSKK